MSLAHDHTSDRVGRESIKERIDYARARFAEHAYRSQLKRIAKHVGDIINTLAPDGQPSPSQMADINTSLSRYAEAITPWAKATARGMLVDVARRDEKVWASIAGDMAGALRREIRTAPTGELFRQLMGEQVELIRSLPLEAAQRVHKLTIEGLSTGMRAGEIAKEIMRSGEVSASRASLIATTEVGRASTNLAMARALHVDSPGYHWTTVRDGRVRQSHRALEGKFIPWDKPPTTDGLTYHAGAGPRCRCFPLIILPDLPSRYSRFPFAA